MRLLQKLSATFLGLAVLFFPLFANSTGIAFDKAGGGTNVNSTTVSVSLAAAAAGEIAVISIGHYRDATLSPSSNDLGNVTVNGVNATSSGNGGFVDTASNVSVGSTNATVWTYYYQNPPTSSVNYTATFASSDNFTDEVITVTLYSGQAAAAAAIDSHSNTSGGSGNYTLSTTVVAANCWIVEAGSGTAVSNTSRQTTAEQIHGDSNGTVSTGSNSVTVTHAGGAGVGVILSLAPAVVAPVNITQLFHVIWFWFNP